MSYLKSIVLFHNIDTDRLYNQFDYAQTLVPQDVQSGYDRVSWSLSDRVTDKVWSPNT